MRSPPAAGPFGREWEKLFGNEQGGGRLRMFLRRLSRDSSDDRRGAPMPPHGAGGGAAERGGGVAGLKPVDFSSAWVRVHDALVRLTSDPAAVIPSDQWLSLYTDIYRVCTYPHPFASGPHASPGMQRRLYEHLLDFLKAHSEAVVQRMTDVSRTASHMEFLVLYANLFRCYTSGMERGGKLLAYLDRYWVTEHHQRKGRDPIDGVLFISELVPLIWRQRVLLPQISELLLRAFNQVVHDLRSAGTPELPKEHLDVMKAVVESYIVLGRTLEPQNPVGFYKEQLEDHLLEQVFRHYEGRSAEFARQAADHSVDDKTVAAYIHVVERCIQAEEAIWASVHPSTAKGAVRVVRKSMLESEPHHEILMAFATHCLSFRHERLDDLQLLYRLLDNDDLNPQRGIDALRQNFLNYVKELGAREVKRVNDEARQRQASPTRPDLSAVMASASLPANYVSSDAIQMMLDLYSHYLNIVRVTLGEDARFSKAFKTACEHFINHLPNISESLAIHTHYFLDKNCPESRSESIDVALDSIILLFNFIHDKDLFHRCYARLLAHRIITFSSVSDDAEKRMMRHLRTVCGYQYAMTFQRMFLDKDLSEQLSAEFKRWARDRERGVPSTPMDVADERGTPLGPHTGNGHGRRKSDSSVDFVETSDGRVTPRSISPKLNQGMRYIGLHDASPLQMLLSKRIFADKNKRYKTNGGEPSSNGSQAPSSGGSQGAAGRSYRSQYFFGEEDWEHMGSLPSGASGLLSHHGHEVMTAFADESAPEVDFFAFVLTGGSWPFETASTGLVLPPVLARYVESFASFYDSKHRRRRLAWLHELGHGEVLARGFDRPYTLCVSTFQMSVLVLLNHKAVAAGIPLEVVMGALDLDLEDLVTSLYPLIKAQLLTATPSVTHISQLTRSHEIAVNPHFTCRRSSRIVFPRKSDEAILPGGAISPRSLDPGRMSPSLLNERKSAVEARVVYLMKHSTTMRHDKLIEGVLAHTKSLGFLPPVDFVCEIIRNDIEKDFIELVEDGPNPLYRYQA